MASSTLIPVLVTMMLLTGVCNTLLTKYQDLQCVRYCDNPARAQTFEQPVLQTAQMFVGESGSWLIVGLASLWRLAAARRKGYEPIADSDTAPQDETNPILKPLVAKDDRLPLHGAKTLLLAIPACCDIAGTTLMNVGLLFVAASIYQMTRGALVLFVGLFSVLFLRRRIYAHQWFALLVVVVGVALVGLAGVIQKSPQGKPVLGGDDVDGPGGESVGGRLLGVVKRAGETVDLGDQALQTALGVFMIAGAQVFTASQFVFEESILERYSVQPLKMVGWEGLFGFLVTIIGMIILHFAVGITPQGQGGYFDAAEGWRQFTTIPAIGWSSLLIMISIGGFNFFGLSITRSVSATSRSIIDTCRTLFIWLVSLGLHWETFKWLQVLGFALLVYGTFLFNDLVAEPWRACVRRRVERVAPLLAEDPIEHS